MQNELKTAPVGPTEKVNEACPFCGGTVDPEGWLRGDGMRGPECNFCGATAISMEVWRQRVPSTSTAAEELEAVLHWRGKHTKAARERDTLRAQCAVLDEGLRAIATRRLKPVDARNLAKQHLNRAGGMAAVPVETPPDDALAAARKHLRTTLAAYVRVGQRQHALRTQLAELKGLLREVTLSPEWSLSVDLQVRISQKLGECMENQ